MKSKSIYIIILITLFFYSCNHKDYSDLFTIHEYAKLYYEWSEIINKKPNKLVIYYSNSMNNHEIDYSDSICHIIESGEGFFHDFIFNEADNLDVSEEIITAKINENNIIQSVGELYTGKTDYSISSPEELIKEFEKQNHHHWDGPPFKNSGIIVEKPIFVKMIPQTRLIKVILNINGESTDFIKSINGQISGIVKSKTPEGKILSYSDAGLSFELVNNEYIGYIRVLGAASDFGNQHLNLKVNFINNSDNDLDIDISDNMKDFNDSLGKSDCIIKINIEVKKTETNFSALIKDWEIVESGDNENIEI